MTVQLRSLLDEAADSRVPVELASTAVRSARRRRSRRMVLGGSVAALAVAAVATLVVSQPARSGDDPRPSDVASLPEQLPVPEGLTTLAPGVMETASSAYVVDGSVVLVDAESGAGAVVDWGTAVDPYPGLAPVGDPLAPLAPGTQVALSPDGSRLLVAKASAGPDDLPPGTALYLVDVATAQILPITGARLVERADDGVAQHQRVVWAPASDAFACACLRPGGPLACRPSPSARTGSH
jgi:hypothetical protein